MVKHFGGVVIGSAVRIGSNAVIDRAQIDDTVVGMGAVVVKAVPAGVTVVENPAKPIVRENR